MRRFSIFISAVIVYGFPADIYHAVFQIKNIAVSGYILFAAFSAIELSGDLADQQGGGCIPEEYLLCSGCEGNYLLRIPTGKSIIAGRILRMFASDYARILGMRNLPVIFIVAGKRLSSLFLMLMASTT